MSDNSSARLNRRGVLLAGATVWASACASGRSPLRPHPFIDVRDHGARGDGEGNETAAVQAALDLCARQGGGTVVVPAGRYVVAGLFLRSHTTLHLAAGAVLQGSTRVEDYPERNETHKGTRRRRGLITAVGSENVTIEGAGALDGRSMAFSTDDLSYAGTDFDAQYVRQGKAFMSQRPFADGPYRKGPPRPGNVLYFLDCKNVTLRGITVRNSPTWNIHMARCRGVWVNGLDVNSRDVGLKIPNDDGMDFTDCEAVAISDCRVETGDDAIVLFGSRGVTVSNCWLRSKSTAVRVGYDGAAKMQGCAFSNLVISNSNRGLGVFVRGPGDIEDVSFSHCTIQTRLHSGRWWGKGEPIHVSCMPWEPDVPRLGRLKGVRFHDIAARSPSGVVIWGHPDSPIRDVALKNVTLQIEDDPLNDAYGGNVDLRLTRDAATNIFARDLPGLLARHVQDLSIENFDLRWPGQPAAFFTSGIEVEDFSGLHLEGFRGEAASGAHPRIELRRGAGARLQGWPGQAERKAVTSEQVKDMQTLP